MDLRYEVGGITGTINSAYVDGFDGKYIVVARGEATESPTLQLYALDFQDHTGKFGLEHQHIPKRFDVDVSPETRVLGGGKLRSTSLAIRFNDYSGKYGGVPSPVLERFGELISEGRHVQIDRVEDLPQDRAIDWENWEPFGFSRTQQTP